MALPDGQIWLVLFSPTSSGTVRRLKSLTEATASGGFTYVDDIVEDINWVIQKASEKTIGAGTKFGF